MIRTLRKKFIAIAMLSLLGTMTVLCATIGIGNYCVAASRADKAIDILHLADVGLQDKILGVVGKLPELFQCGQAIRRLLDSGQEVTVLRGKSGKCLGHRLQFVCVTACGMQRFQILHEIGFGFAQRHHPF